MDWELWPTPKDIDTPEQELIVYEAIGLALACGLDLPSNWKKELDIDTEFDDRSNKVNHRNEV